MTSYVQMRSLYEKTLFDLLEYPLNGSNDFNGLYLEFESRQTRNGIKTFVLNQTHPSKIFEGFELAINDPFEIMTEQTSHYPTIQDQKLYYLIDPQATDIDDSLIELSLEV
jgi:hypothetical protein